MTKDGSAATLFLPNKREDIEVLKSLLQSTAEQEHIWQHKNIRSFPFLRVLIKDAVNCSDHTPSALGKCMFVEHWWNGNNKGKQDDWDKTKSSTTPSTTNTKRTGMVWN